MMLTWSPVDGALMVSGSRRTAIDTAWRQVPERERTKVRRRKAVVAEPLALLVCGTCRVLFEPWRKGLKYCSPDCSRARGLTCCACDRPINRSPTTAPQGRSMCHSCRAEKRMKAKGVAA